MHHAPSLYIDKCHSWQKFNKSYQNLTKCRDIFVDI